MIGKRTSHVSAAGAMGHVFGYLNFIDGSARGLPPPGNVFFQMKSRDTFAPLGPVVGFILIVSPQDAEPVLAALLNAGETAFVCGQLAKA